VFIGVIAEVCLAGFGIWAASGGSGATGVFVLFAGSGMLGAITLLHFGIVLVAIVRGTRRQPTPTGLYLAWTHLIAVVTGIAVIGLTDSVNSLIPFIALPVALNLAAMASAAGKHSRIWPALINNHPDNTPCASGAEPYPGARVRTVADVCPARLPAAAAGEAQVPFFVANLQSTRAWLRSLLCYSPQTGCWVLYWPDPAHRYLIEGPHNPLRRTPADSHLAQGWAVGCLDTQAELEAFSRGAAGHRLSAHRADRPPVLGSPVHYRQPVCDTSRTMRCGAVKPEPMPSSRAITPAVTGSLSAVAGPAPVERRWRLLTRLLVATSCVLTAQRILIIAVPWTVLDATAGPAKTAVVSFASAGDAPANTPTPQPRRRTRTSDEDTTAPGGLMKDTHGPRPDRPRMSGERLELRRLTGKFALLVTFIYLLVLMAAAYGLQHDDSLPTVAYALILAPAAGFVLATIDAIALHRTREPDRTKTLHRRCAVHTLIALALLGSTAVSISHLQP
jgi:hypothetical protein